MSGAAPKKLTSGSSARGTWTRSNGLRDRPFAVGLPARRTKEVRPPMPPRARLPHIAAERDPFVEGDDDGIVREQGLHQAVATRQVVALGREGTEHAVKNDEHPAIVVVEIFRIGSVVDAMMRRRVQDIFQPTELWNPLRVQPELIEQIDCARDKDWRRLEPEPYQGHIEDARPGQPSGPPEAIGRGKIDVIRRMMNGMRRPEPPNAVAAAMKPVVAEILADEERRHCDSGIERNREEPVTAGQIKGGRRDAQRKERQYNVLTTERIGERCQVRAPIVVAPHHECQNQALKRRDHNHDWECESEDADKKVHRALLSIRRAKEKSITLADICLSHPSFSSVVLLVRTNTGKLWIFPEYSAVQSMSSGRVNGRMA